MAKTSNLGIVVESLSMILPSFSREDVQYMPLSIVDCIVVNYAKCAAVWFYPPPSSAAPALDTVHLQHSLSKTLSYYRPWCGRLSYAVAKANGNHNERYQRVAVTYNTKDDRGVSMTTATATKALSDVLPDTKTRTTVMRIWDGSVLPAHELLPSEELSMSSRNPDAPNMAVQFTKFSCGSSAIAIQITHCLADAQSLSQFARDWSSISRALLSGQPEPVLCPVFDPQLLDSFAAGDIDAQAPDTQIQNQARILPQHRYDWYLATRTQPRPPVVPMNFDSSVKLSSSVPIPWETWDYSGVVSHRVLHLTRAEIESIYDQASAGFRSLTKISKHDALLAYLWARITAARELSIGTTSWLDVTLGIRARVISPLPNSFLGSPIMHAPVKCVAGSGSVPISTLANNIRMTIAEFTPQAISNWLHDRAFEYAPQRLWGTCLGREHILLTSWVRSSVYDVVFEDGMRPIYVKAVMPYCDGLVEIMEGPGKPQGNWISNGVDVDIYLEEKVMEKFCRDWKPDMSV